MSDPTRPHAQAGSNLLASVQRVLATLLAIGRNRMDLFATELEEERQRLLAVLAWGAAALLLFIFGLVFLALLVTVLLWDSHRLLSLTVVAVFFLLGAGWAWQQAARRLHRPGGLFAASLGELAADQEALSAAAQAHAARAGVPKSDHP